MILTKRTKIFFLILTVIFVSSCQKFKLFDYRTKYIGNYEFEIHYSSWNINDYYFDTTYFYNGTILFGDDKGTLSINYKNNSTFEVFIDKEGQFEENNYLSGKFTDKDNVEFGFSCSGPGCGMGGGSSTHVIGKKFTE